MPYEGLLINRSNIIDRTFDKWGEEESVSIRRNRPCRIMYGNLRVVNFKGEDDISSAKLFYKRDEDIQLSHMIEFDDREHAIVNIRKPQDSRRIHHIEVYVK